MNFSHTNKVRIANIVPAAQSLQVLERHEYLYVERGDKRNW